jgi:sugar/nucleoside kinase (ribokinase family)
MRILVVGTIVADTIEHEGGGSTESLGGIAHTVSALSALVGNRHSIVPVCRVGRDHRRRIDDWAAGLEGVSLAAVVPDPGPQPTVRLSYRESARPGERVEQLRCAWGPLQDHEMEPALEAGADVVLLNCITGNDVSPEGLARLRRASPRRYLDVHSLALGTRPDGTRFYRERDDWSTWLGFADVVQSNVAEAATVCGVMAAGEAEVRAALERKLETASPDTDEPTRIDDVPAPTSWLLTTGAGGAVLFDRRRGRVTTSHAPAPAVAAADPTGAGDAFGAAYVCAWSDGCEPAEALQRAVIGGAAACMQDGVPDPAVFRRAVRELERAAAPGR